jgi:hypothetical protein
MQRIGRVDRRRSREIEEALLRDHRQDSVERETIYFWNFLPPEELENLLSLYKRVSQKTLRISKTLGIEGKQLLTPEDDYNSLQEFNAAYEGTESKEEEMALEYQRLMKENPNYDNDIKMLPKKIFSGKAGETSRGFFFCYELPSKRPDGTWTESGEGFYKWYFYNTETGDVFEQPYEIWRLIQSEKNTPRVFTIEESDFIPIRKSVEAHINKSYMKAIQAPIGIKPRLSEWMQLV